MQLGLYIGLTHSGTGTAPGHVESWWLLCEGGGITIVLRLKEERSRTFQTLEAAVLMWDVTNRLTDYDQSSSTP